MMVLQLLVKVVKFGCMVPELTSPKKRINGMELSSAVYGFVPRVSSRMTSSKTEAKLNGLFDSLGNKFTSSFAELIPEAVRVYY